MGNELESLSELSERIVEAFRKHESGDLTEAERLSKEVLAIVSDREQDTSIDAQMQSDLSVVRGQALNQLAILATNRGDLNTALSYYRDVVNIAEKTGNDVLRVASLCNIGSVYSNMDEFDNANKVQGQALVIAKSIGHLTYQANILCNLGGNAYSQSSFEVATSYFEESLALFRSIDNENGIALILGNLGSALAMQEKFDESLPYLQQALELAEKIGDTLRVILQLDALGNLYAKPTWQSRDFAKAEKYLLRALQLSEQIQSKRDRSFVLHSLTKVYKLQGKFESALELFEEHHDLELQIRSREAKELADKLGYERTMAERDREVEIHRAQTTATRTLLHRVLPEPIAERIMSGDELVADYFPNISILFADIKGFTTISAGMPAFVVVKFLDSVFAQFDSIMRKYGCEKIKTIGDGYMAVCGAPNFCEDNAERLTFAAFEMIDSLRIPEGLDEYFPDGDALSIRIGIHCGPVVAGVVGKERFVYDVYSDAVNTASRMESHGEAGRIHVTSDFAQHLQNRFMMTKNSTHGITFEKRGEIEIKGKGKMRTYFLERA